MSAFSQLNGHTSLPHGGRARLSVDWSGAAFSQLNAAQSSTPVCGRHPTFSWAPFSQLNTFDFFERPAQKTHSLQAGAFSQLNGHTSLPNGGLAGLSVDWPGAAFSQLNAPQVRAHVLVGSRALSLQPFSQLNGHSPSPNGEAGEPLAGQQGFAFRKLNTSDILMVWSPASLSLCGEVFSQLNACTTSRCIKHKTKDLSSTFAHVGRVFSQLNAVGHAPLGQTQKDAFSEEAFSQLNALERQSNRHPGSATCSQSQPVRRRPGFKGLKRRAYLHTAHEPRTTRGSVHLELGNWRNRMK